MGTNELLDFGYNAGALTDLILTGANVPFDPMAAVTHGGISFVGFDAFQVSSAGYYQISFGFTLDPDMSIPMGQGALSPSFNGIPNQALGLALSGIQSGEKAMVSTSFIVFLNAGTQVRLNASFQATALATPIFGAAFPSVYFTILKLSS